MGFNDKKTNSGSSYILNSGDTFKRGLTMQREIFKNAKLDNDYDQMCDALENIKAEIKHKAKPKGELPKLMRVERVLDWYRTIESGYIKNTQEGRKVVFPSNITYLVNKRLTACYEEIMRMLGVLDLL